MIGWLLRRLAQSFIVVLLMTVIVFIGLHAIGNPVDILIGQDVTITAKDMLTMNAWFDSSRDPMTYGSRDGFEPGIFTEGVVDSSGLVPVPKASARTNLQINNYIGINEGAAAGQTVMHLHVHLIPRFSGDRADPRGGVRWIFPERADYWSEKG